MSYTAQGRLKHIGETEQKTDQFQVRDAVIETLDDKYPQLVKFQFVQDRCNLLDSYELNDLVTIHFDLRGREWDGKYFTNLNGWKIEKDAPSEQPTTEPKNQDDAHPF